MKDERIKQIKNKVGREMMVIILCGVAGSFLIKTLIFNMSFKECITEYLILILSPLYQFARMHTMKTSISSEHENKNYSKFLLIPISTFLAIFSLALFRQLRNPTIYNWQNPVILSFVFLALSIIIFLITNWYNQQRNRKYEQEFDDDSRL